MEIVKKSVNDHITRVELGAEYNNTTNKMTGQIELDIESQAYFVDVVNTAIEEGCAHIIVDMQNVSYVDSSGLWALFEGHKKAVQRNGQLVLVNPTRDVRRILDITKMSSKIQVFAEEAEAIKSIQ